MAKQQKKSVKKSLNVKPLTAKQLKDIKGGRAAGFVCSSTYEQPDKPVFHDENGGASIR